MDWLILDGLTLGGVPPEKYWPFTYKVSIVAANQFKSVTLPLTIRVSYGLPLILSTFGKISVAIAIWIYLNIILNILMKSVYRYPTDFTIKVGQKILPDKIKPIACILKELKESQTIIKGLQQMIAKELNCASVNRTELAQYFVSYLTQRIDGHKLNNAINSVVKSIPTSEKRKLKCYIWGDSSRKELINQLVLNEVVTAQLSLASEKLTKQAFEKVKHTWTSLIKYEEGTPGWQLCLDKKNVLNQLQIQGIRINDLRRAKGSRRTATINLELTSMVSTNQDIMSDVHNEPSGDDENSNHTSSSTIPNNLDSQLINKDTRSDSSYSQQNFGINLDLLHAALLAYIYKQHHLNVDILFVKVLARKKSNKYWCMPKFLAKFLKLDLRPILSASGEHLGYGINYRIDHGVIYFYGKATGDSEGKTLVIQISKKRRIIRELWLNCFDEYLLRERSISVAKEFID